MGTVENKAQDAVEPDWMREFFDSCQPAAQAADWQACERAETLSRLRSTVAEQACRAQKEHDDWQSRVYKRNTHQVEFHGDGPCRNGGMSVGAINESRRHNAMDALTKERIELDKLSRAMSTDTGAERTLVMLEGLLELARVNFKKGLGDWAGSADVLFESYLLEDLKFRGPGGKGNVTSNAMSRAMLAAMKAPEGPELSEADEEAPAPGM